MSLCIGLGPAIPVRGFSGALPSTGAASPSRPPSSTRFTTDCRFAPTHARVRDRARRTPESGSGTEFPPSGPLFRSMPQTSARPRVPAPVVWALASSRSAPMQPPTGNLTARYATRFDGGPICITHRSYRPPRYASGCCHGPAWTRRRYSSRSLAGSEPALPSGDALDRSRPASILTAWPIAPSCSETAAAKPSAYPETAASPTPNRR